MTLRLKPPPLASRLDAIVMAESYRYTAALLGIPGPYTVHVAPDAGAKLAALFPDGAIPVEGGTVRFRSV